MSVHRALARTVALAFFAVTSATPLHAQLWYNGNFDGANALSSEVNTSVAQSMTYDNFVVTGGSWIVTGVFGDFLADRVFSTANYEIRTGVSDGIGGTLLYGGSGLSVTQVATGRTGFDLTEYRISIGALNLTLLPGTYWLGISPVGTGSGRAFVSTTSGANGVNALLDGQSFFNSAQFGTDFQLDAAGDVDFAYGVDGTTSVIPDITTVPEPSSVALLATGLAGLAVTARRRRAAR